MCEETARYFLYAASIAAPSAPADFSHSAVMVAPILARPALSAGVGSLTLMPAALRFMATRPMAVKIRFRTS